MLPVIVPWSVFVVVFVAVCTAYFLGRGEKRVPTWFGRYRLIHHYRPPVGVVLDYRTAEGWRILKKVRVVQSRSDRRGRLYLFGSCGGQPRLFRVDRIITIATPDGEVLDTQRFLIDQLSIPPALCRGPVPPPAPTAHPAY